MAEETPGNLSGMFGGWMSGRAAGNRRLDASVDRLEETISRFSDSLEKLTGVLNNIGSNVGGQQTGAASHGGRRANGGGASFGGAAAGGPPSPPTEHRGSRESYWPTNRGYSPRHSDPSPGMRGYMGEAWQQHRGNIIAGGAAGAVGLMGVYAMNHTQGSFIGSALAQQYGSARPSEWEGYYNRSLRGNFTAHGDADHWRTMTMMTQMGQRMGSSGFNAIAGNVYSMSAVNPQMSNAAGMQAVQGLSSVGTFNRMRGMGVNPLGAGGQGDPRSVARQLLQRMGGSRVRTREQVEAALGPAGSITVTLNAWVSQGIIPAESVEAVRSEMRNILTAQTEGMDYAEYNRNAQAANRSGAARERLENAGIATNTLPQRQRRKEGLQRETEAETIKGFVEGVEAATSTLEQFRKGLNKILSIPGVGETVGGATGFFNSAGNLLSRLIPGADGPANMSSSAAVYGGAVGAGMAMASGPANMSASAVNYGGASGAGGGGGRAGGTGSAGSRYNLGPVKPWVAKAADVMGSRFGIKTVYGFGQRSNVSDHPKGLALDFMCGRSAGDRLAAFAVANHKALNITYIIWRQRIWSINNKGWKQMEDRGSVTANHYDHVHISFLASPANADLGGLRGGGGGAATGSGGGGLGQGAASPDNGTSAGFASSGGGGGGANAFGGFSEYAVLGLGGGGNFAGGGGGGGSLGMSAGGVSARGGSSGMGGPGPAGSVSVGAYNVLNSTSNAASQRDLKRIMGQVDALSLNEIVGNKNQLGRWLRGQDWGYYKARGRASDSAVAWDKDEFTALRTGSRGLNPRNNGAAGLRNRHAAYVLLQDKDTGEKFWQISAHTVPRGSHGGREGAIMREQYASLARLEQELSRTGIPVVLAGDLNNRNPRISGMGRTKFNGIDHILAGDGARIGRTGTNRNMSSDHPFVRANISLGGGGSARVTGRGGTPQQNIALGRQMAAARGWSGAQWSALQQLWMRESGWRTDADNPSSSAYGIPQALTATHGLGDKYKNDPRTQIAWGLNYIAGRYGNPANAWNFWQKNHWYSAGEWDVRDDVDARVHKGEMIVPSKIADVIREELTAPGIRDNLGGGRNRGGSGITFEYGAVQVNLMQGTRQEAERAGRMVVDAMMEDRRMKALAEG